MAAFSSSVFSAVAFWSSPWDIIIHRRTPPLLQTIFFVVDTGATRLDDDDVQMVLVVETSAADRGAQARTVRNDEESTMLPIIIIIIVVTHNNLGLLVQCVGIMGVGDLILVLLLLCFVLTLRLLKDRLNNVFLDDSSSQPADFL